MSDNITPQGYVYGAEPRSTHPFWGGEGGSGAVFTPHLEAFEDETGKGNILSWTNDGDLPNPDPVKIYDGKDGKDITETDYDWVYLIDILNGTITFSELFERIKELEEKGNAPECDIAGIVQLEYPSGYEIRKETFNVSTGWRTSYETMAYLEPFTHGTAGTGYEGPMDPEDPNHHDLIWFEFVACIGITPNAPAKIHISITDVDGTLYINHNASTATSANIAIGSSDYLVDAYVIEFPPENFNSEIITQFSFYYSLCDLLGVKLPHKETT